MHVNMQVHAHDQIAWFQSSFCTEQSKELATFKSTIEIR